MAVAECVGGCQADQFGAKRVERLSGRWFFSASHVAMRMLWAASGSGESTLMCACAAINAYLTAIL